MRSGRGGVDRHEEGKELMQGHEEGEIGREGSAMRGGQGEGRAPHNPEMT